MLDLDKLHWSRFKCSAQSHLSSGDERVISTQFPENLGFFLKCENAELNKDF